MKRNFLNNRPPTLEEMKLYHEGKLNAGRRSEIDTEAKENPLLAEALEGFAVIPAFASVPDAGTLFSGDAGSIMSAKTASAAGSNGFSTSMAAAAKTFTSWWTLNSVIIVVALTAAISGFVFFSQNKDDNYADGAKSGQASELVNEAAEQNAKGSGINYDSEKSSAIVSSSQAGEIQNNQEVLAQQTGALQNTPISQPANASFADNQFREESAAVNMSTLPTLTLPEPAIAVEEIPAPVIANEKTGMVAINIKQVLHYKVADYTDIRTDSWKAFDGKNVPAKYESKEEMEKSEKELAAKSVPYINYVSECMTALDEGNYHLAVEKFAPVLSQYPDDVNAQFYSALSLYRNGEYAKAIPYFDMTLKNMIRTFNEEAEFYKAMSLKSTGRRDEADALFTRIVIKNKFYASQALKEME